VPPDSSRSRRGTIWPECRAARVGAGRAERSEIERGGADSSTSAPRRADPCSARAGSPPNGRALAHAANSC